MGNLFGNKDAKRAQQKAEEEARKSRQLQEIANNRQLASAQAKEGEGQPSRRKVRGRALFKDVDESDGSTLA